MQSWDRSMDSEAWKQRSWSAKDWAYLVGSESVDVGVLAVWAFVFHLIDRCTVLELFVFHIINRCIVLLHKDFAVVSLSAMDLTKNVVNR